jgi:cobyrinic acid a,c-diamide synthase
MPTRDGGRARVVIGALRGGSGKTLLTTGLLGACRARGISVAPFKKGPDYIDPAWLTHAAGRACRALDPHLMSAAAMLTAVRAHGDADLVVIEGNHGLMDGIGAGDAGSTAALARLLAAPVIVLVDATRATRTIAAMVLGCQRLDPDLRIAGVILNRVGSRRHEASIRAAVEAICGVPVLGSIPRLPDLDLPERHLGLVTPAEHREATAVVERARAIVEAHVDVDRVRQIANAAPPLPAGDAGGANAGGGTGAVATGAATPGKRVRIGVVRDRAFTFYYVENLEALERLGADLVWIDALNDERLPALDALYIGGGYPETHARALAANGTLRAAIREEAAAGLPIVAECGGLIYLGEAYVVDGVAHPMVGVFPVTWELGDRPLGHGYTAVEAAGDNAFFPRGTRLAGHEFRYSQPRVKGPLAFALRMTRGHGFDGEHDGLVSGNVLASFCHFHAGGAPAWAGAVVTAARAHRRDGAVSPDLVESAAGHP